MFPLVSIIIPVFNREHFLVQTLDSVLEQSYQNWECIIVDDCSTDNSLKVAQDFALKDNRFLCLSKPKERTKGANACRNFGFEKSSGTLINWFDSDDIMHKDFLKLKVDAFHNTNIDAVISKTQMFKSDVLNIVGKENRTNLSINTLEDFLKLKIAWYLPDVMWKKDFLKNIPLFDEELLAGQDRDFHARILLYNPQLIVIDKYLTYYRLHEESITSSVDNLKNVTLKVSHLKSIVRLVDLLNKKGKLNSVLKAYFFNAMIKYLPFVWKNSNDLKTLKVLLKQLSYPNYKIFIGWIRFYMSFYSFKLFGKGEKFLK